MAIGTRRPRNRLLGGTGGIEQICIQPADHLPAAAGPQRIVGVFGEPQMVGAEAGVDEGVLFGGRIEDRQLAPGVVRWKGLRGRMRGTLAAPVGILVAANPRGEPHAALAVEHRVVNVGAAVPDGFFVPVCGRRDDGIVVGRRRIGIAYRCAEGRRHVGGRVEDREVVGAEFRRTVQLAVAVHGGIAAVSCSSAPGSASTLAESASP